MGTSMGTGTADMWSMERFKQVSVDGQLCGAIENLETIDIGWGRRKAYPGIVTISCGGKRGSTIKVQQKQRTTLMLSEVEVFADNRSYLG